MRYYLKNNKAVIVTIAVLTVLLVAGALNSITNKDSVQKKLSDKEIIELVKQEAEEFGLQEVEVIQEEKDIYNPNKINLSIKTSNFDEFDGEDLIAMDIGLHKITDYRITISYYESKGDIYICYDSALIISKNGDESYYNDFENSSSYKKIYEDEEENTNITDKGSSISYLSDEEKAVCWSVAIKAVKNNLKSPSSAQFPFSYASDGVTITKSDGIYVVNAYVEADNSFGALIRTKFLVTIERDGDLFTATDILFDE